MLPVDVATGNSRAAEQHDRTQAAVQAAIVADASAESVILWLKAE
ncbi:hypothetical protein [Duffyella gerundensis]|nr:hypothetical protein [Duffyella gerundensis]